MALEKKNYVGEIGTPIIANMNDDILSALNLKWFVKKGDDSEVEWIPEIYDSTHTYYITQTATDFNSAGEYKVNVYVEIGDWKGLFNTFKFTIHAKYA